MRWIKIIVTGLLVVSVVLVGFAWALLQSRIFNDVRRDLIAGFFSERLGHELVIDGQARVDPGVNSVFTLTEVSIPGVGIDDVNLAELSELTFKSNTYELLFGDPDFFAINISGLGVNLLTAADGRHSWSHSQTSGDAALQQADRQDGEEVGKTARDAAGDAFRAKRLLDFLVQRSEKVTDIRVLVDNNKTGFDFDFELAEMIYDVSSEADRSALTSKGTVNGVSFDLSGDYKKEGPFRTSVNFGEMTLIFEGEEKPADEGGGYTGQLEFETGEISELLSVLRLKPVIEGTGGLSMSLEETNGITEVKTFSTELTVASGKQYKASGSIADLRRVSGVDIDLSARFHPEGQPPAPATRLAELRLTNASARLVGAHSEITIEDATFQTNAFEETLDNFGPLAIGSLRRTSDGKLELLNISLQAGPRDAPFIRAEGHVGDALEGREFEIDGQVLAPVKLLLADLDPEVAGRFGTIKGTFSFDDKTGDPRLSGFRVRTTDTDLWYLDANAVSGDRGDRIDGRVDLKSGISDTAAFFGGLGLKQIDVSPVELRILAEVDESRLTTEFDSKAGQSDLATFLTLAIDDEGERTLTGRIESEELRIDDLRGLVSIGVELQKANFVVGGAAKPSDDQKSQEATEVQPLVLPEKERTLESLLAEEGVQPLVLPEPELKDIISVENVLRTLDVDVGIAIKRLSGVQGVSRISSELVASRGKAKLGPIDVSYGGGFVKAQAQMDLIERPDVVNISGSTGGWDFGKILDSVGAGVNAYGILNGNFNLTGQYGSLRSFINSMNGAVTVRMSNGRIATSLLELAGLGVLPWLFSQERRERQTQIACLSAPVKINAGRMSFGQVVVETRRVQAVAKGELNWPKDKIDVRVEARPVGKPLSRSAWPVNISGRLTAPDIKPQVGGSFSRRSDGARTMPAQRKACVPDILQLQ